MLLQVLQLKVTHEGCFTTVILGVLIPQNVDSIVRFETKAEFVIVVEKDTIFQKLLDEDFRKHMPVPFILITVSSTFK